MYPEYFTDVFSQLAKLFFAVAPGYFRLDASGDLPFQSLVDRGQFGGLGNALCGAGLKAQ